MYRVSSKKKDTQTVVPCSRTRLPTLFKLTINIVRKMAKIAVTKVTSSHKMRFA